MQYIDPYALFELELQSPEDLSRSMLRRARQKVLAEFELSQDVVIELKGHRLDKATALRLIDELEDPHKRIQHWFMHQDSYLQQFLEHQKVRYLRNIRPGEEIGDAEFRKFLSHQLSPIFDRLLTDNFKQGRKPEVSLLIQRLDLIDSRDMDTALKGTLRHLNLNMQTIREALDGGPDQLMFFEHPELYHPTLVELMNRLPRIYQHVRNRYASILQDLAIALENHLSYTHKAFLVICAAAELDTDISTREHINHTKVELWKRQRAQQERDMAQEQSYSYTSSSKEQSEPEPNPQNNSYSRREDRRNANAVWVGILMLILLIAFLSRGSWRTAPSNRIDFTLPDYALDAEKAMESLQAMMEKGEFIPNPESETIRYLEAFLDAELSPSDPADPIMRDYRSWKTGDVPYDYFFSLISKGRTRDKLVLENKSELDLVTFIENRSGEIRGNYFIAPGDQFEVEYLEPGVFTIYAFAGKKWLSNWVSWEDDIRLGGFTEQAMVPLSYDPEQSPLVASLSFQGKGEPNQHQIPVTQGLSFDLEGWTLKVPF